MAERGIADSADARLDPSNESLVVQAYNRLIQMMLAGELKPGSLLQERRLASILKISRTPLREALGKLEAKSLVTREGGRFLTAYALDVTRLVETFGLLRLLECEFAGLAVGRIGRADYDRISSNARTFLGLKNPSPAEYWAVDDDFHGMLAKVAGNKFGATLSLDFRRRAHFLFLQRTKEQMMCGIREHLAVLEAIRSDDAVRARDLMDHHFLQEKQAVLSAILDHEGLRSPGS